MIVCVPAELCAELLADALVVAGTVVAAAVVLGTVVVAAVDAGAVVVILAGETTDTVSFAASSVDAHSGIDEASSPQPVRVSGTVTAASAANSEIITFLQFLLTLNLRPIDGIDSNL